MKGLKLNVLTGFFLFLQRKVTTRKGVALGHEPYGLCMQHLRVHERTDITLNSLNEDQADLQPL